MRFESPWFLVLGIVLVGVYFWQRKRPTRVTLAYSSVGDLRELEDRGSQVLFRLASIIRYVALGLIVVALARPQGVFSEKEIVTEGISIMLALDVSASMAAEDFAPVNRLEGAKQKIRAFVEGRPADRVGLVVFGGDAFTQVPLTLDHRILGQFLGRLKLGMAGNGTSIGMAIVTGLNRLRVPSTMSRIMVLLTDGENNGGEIDPLTAAGLAEKMGVKIYTVGIGKEGGAPIPGVDSHGRKAYFRDPATGKLVLTRLDEMTLKAIAAKTHGHYFRAVDEDSLERIYAKINQLEKSEIKTKLYVHYEEYFRGFLWAAVLLLGVEFGLKYLILRMHP